MSTRSEIQDQIRILKNSIRSLDIEILNVQSRLSNLSQGHSTSTIEGWKNDLRNKKNRRETYKSELRNYENKLKYI